MKAILLTHADHEGGGLLHAALSARGFSVDERRLHRGDPLPAAPDACDALVAMGGAMDAWDDSGHPWLAPEAALLAASARAGVATLGVCLGAQLLARGLGARVFRGNAGGELGLAPLTLTEAGRADPLLAPLDGHEVLHWHFDTFDLPAGTVHLASTPRYAHQAFRLGPRAYGVQFHVECDALMRQDWATRGAAELVANGVSPASLTGAPALDVRGRAFAASFAALASGANLG